MGARIKLITKANRLGMTYVCIEIASCLLSSDTQRKHIDAWLSQHDDDDAFLEAKQARARGHDSLYIAIKCGVLFAELIFDRLLIEKPEVWSRTYSYISDFYENVFMEW